jgi:hypothetical protein
MAGTSRVRTIGKVTGVAVITAPLVRRLAKDAELRGDVADFIASAGHLVRDLGDDGRLREDLEHMAATMQSGAEHMRRDVRPRRVVRTLVVVTGGIALGVTVAAVLLYPRTRRGVVRVADQTVHGASARVDAVRRKITGSGAVPEEEWAAPEAAQAAA